MLLDFVGEFEIKGAFSPGLPLDQHRECLARIVITVVEKENDLTADLRLQSSCGDNFCIKKTLREETARLLTEADDWLRHLLRADRLQEDRALQNYAKEKHCDAADQIIPEIADTEGPEKHQNKHLCE